MIRRALRRTQFGPAGASAPAGPGARRLGWFGRGAIVMLVASSVVGCSDEGSSSSSERTLAGTFTVSFRSGATTPCAGLPDHPDVIDGAPVVVTDTEGAVLITGRLGKGIARGSNCVRPVRLAGVAKRDVYRISIATYGPIDITAEAIDAAGGSLDLRLGA